MEEDLVRRAYDDGGEEEDPGVALDHELEEAALPGETEEVEVGLEDGVEVEHAVADDDDCVSRPYAAAR